MSYGQYDPYGHPYEFGEETIEIAPSKYSDVWVYDERVENAALQREIESLLARTNRVMPKSYHADLNILDTGIMREFHKHLFDFSNHASSAAGAFEQKERERKKDALRNMEEKYVRHIQH